MKNDSIIHSCQKCLRQTRCQNGHIYYCCVPAPSITTKALFCPRVCASGSSTVVCSVFRVFLEELTLGKVSFRPTRNRTQCPTHTSSDVIYLTGVWMNSCLRKNYAMEPTWQGSDTLTHRKSQFSSRSSTQREKKEGRTSMYTTVLPCRAYQLSESPQLPPAQRRIAHCRERDILYWNFMFLLVSTEQPFIP